jgi:hypothetical protein
MRRQDVRAQEWPAVKDGATLPEYANAVQELEAGKFPACLGSQAAAIDHLEKQICGAPWATAEERSEAQHLVERLSRLRHRLQTA